MQAGKEYLKHMGQYPVIFLSLNSSKQPLYEMAYLSIADEIRKEYSRHSYLLRDDRMEESIKKIYNDDIEELVIAFEDGNCNKISDIITGQLMETISFYDYREDYYHGFLAGLLKYNKKYFVKSNRKSGLSRYDLVMKTRRIRQGKAIIIELKVAESINNMEKACEKAVGQIEKFHYDKVMMLQKERLQMKKYLNQVAAGIVHWQKLGLKYMEE